MSSLTSFWHAPIQIHRSQHSRLSRLGKRRITRSSSYRMCTLKQQTASELQSYRSLWAAETHHRVRSIGGGIVFDWRIWAISRANCVNVTGVSFRWVALWRRCEDAASLDKSQYWIRDCRPSSIVHTWACKRHRVICGAHSGWSVKMALCLTCEFHHSAWRVKTPILIVPRMRTTRIRRRHNIAYEWNVYWYWKYREVWLNNKQ